MGELTGILKASSIDADFSLFGVLFSNNLDIRELEIKNLNFKQESLNISRGSYTALLDIANVREDLREWRGRIRLNAQNVQASYNEELPMINKKLTVLVTKLELQAALNKKVLRFQSTKNRIMTDMGLIKVEGSIILNQMPTVNLKVSISPKGQLVQLLNEQREFLNAPGLGLAYLLDDPIEININGPANRIRFQPLKKAGGAPANVPNMRSAPNRVQPAEKIGQ